eukprot:2835131-Amphidinium_carterae.1
MSLHHTLWLVSLTQCLSAQFCHQALTRIPFPRNGGEQVQPADLILLDTQVTEDKRHDNGWRLAADPLWHSY